MVEGRLQLALEIARHNLSERLIRNEAASATKFVEPAHPGRDVIDLVAIDTAQHRSAFGIADALERGRHFGGHIQPARFEHQRHDGKAGKQIIGSRGSQFPQPVMGRQVAITGSEIGEPPHQQLEMDGLLRSHADPVVEEGAGQRFTPEPRDDIPGEIDRVEFDVREGMKERDAPCRRAESPPLWHLFWRTQQRPLGPRRAQAAAANSRHRALRHPRFLRAGGWPRPLPPDRQSQELRPPRWSGSPEGMPAQPKTRSITPASHAAGS